jgi:hypothetical protein
MFDQLFRSPAVLRRHRDGPLAQERVAFLTRLAIQGSPTGTLLKCARYGLAIAQALHEASRRVWGLRLRRTDRGLALASPVMWPSAKIHGVGVLIAIFRSSIPSPPIPLCTLRRAPRDALRNTRGRAGRYPLLVRLLHSLLRAGLSRRTDFHFGPRMAPLYTEVRRVRPRFLPSSDAFSAGDCQLSPPRRGIMPDRI